ncbi:MAG TPA: PQQ-dependent sugar dehydrogenase, partial [Tepidisphaeraceae bacterium]|nr:PQQ-dependent sugar dehydrogenase [Tepidisphaeraceae bacterium]
RIDPNGTNSANHQYGIPPTNPFAAGGGLGEIYTYGMRNPYRFSFDSVTGHLIVGDVGQDTREEVDDVTVGGAGNYGWPYKEGTSTNSNWTAPGGFTSIAPIAEYQNSAANNGGGDAVIGGFVYHGSLMPQLDGKYIFGDLDGAAGGIGKLMYTDPAGGGQIFELKYDLTNGGASPASINSQLFGFGQDSNNELYALFANGQILHFVPEPTCIATLAPMLVLLLRKRA